MERHSTSELITRTAFAIVGLFMTIVTLVYLWQTFILGKVIDYSFNFGKVVVPPESYPILLLVLWSVSQRLKARMRPTLGTAGKFWAIEDLVEAIAAAMVIGVIAVVTIMWTHANMSFILVLAAFGIQAGFDLALNGWHRNRAAGDLPFIGQIPNEVKRKIKVVADFEYVYRHPISGEEIAWNPKGLIDASKPTTTN